MKKQIIIFALIGLICMPALAHRLNEYLQATILSIEAEGIQATMRLVPGVAVAPAVIASVDLNHDGAFSSEEQHAYAERVLADLQLKEDGRLIPLHLSSASFPSVDSMKLGTGEIQLAFSAHFPAKRGKHQLSFEDRHQIGISVYLVNTLVPQDRNLGLQTQIRNVTQSFYQVQFVEAAGAPAQDFTWSGFDGAFRLGVQHIAEGTDHLLFLLTLLLPAPVLAVSGRWIGCGTMRRNLAQVLKVATAFTLGHSLTLALSSFGLIHLPSRPVEVLIAVSILISAIHAMRPIFPGFEAFIAGTFGLIHGLAFASILTELGVSGWYRLVNLLGFNLGIEAMQIVVIASILPALLLLSRTDSYPALRVLGAVLASVASCVWIGERVLNQPDAIGKGIETLAHHGMQLSAAFWIFCVLGWLIKRRRRLLKVYV